LLALLNSGELQPWKCRQAARRISYGRALRVAVRGGRNRWAQQLVSEGLAEPWQGRRSDWCVMLAAR
jgi:micrococcal nuclease